MPDGTFLPAIPQLDPMGPAWLTASAYLATFERESTQKSYTGDLRMFFRWCARHHLDPLAASRAHLQLYIVYLRQERKLAPVTTNRRMAPVSGFYDTAVLDGHIEHSPRTPWPRSPHPCPDPQCWRPTGTLK